MTKLLINLNKNQSTSFDALSAQVSRLKDMLTVIESNSKYILIISKLELSRIVPLYTISSLTYPTYYGLGYTYVRSN